MCIRLVSLLRNRCKNIWHPPPPDLHIITLMIMFTSCITMGKVHGWGTLPKCDYELQTWLLTSPRPQGEGIPKILWWVGKKHGCRSNYNLFKGLVKIIVVYLIRMNVLGPVRHISIVIRTTGPLCHWPKHIKPLKVTHFNIIRIEVNLISKKIVKNMLIIFQRIKSFKT